MELDSQKLDRLLELTEKNHKILRSLNRAVWVGRVMTAVYWLIIAGVSVGAFLYLKPYLKQIESLYDGAKGGVQSVNGIDFSAINSFIKNFQKQ